MHNLCILYAFSICEKRDSFRAKNVSFINCLLSCILDGHNWSQVYKAISSINVWAPCQFCRIPISQMQTPNSDSKFRLELYAAKSISQSSPPYFVDYYREWISSMISMETSFSYHMGYLTWAIWYGPYLMVSSFYTPGKYISILNLLDTSSGWLTNRQSRTLHMVNPKISRAILVTTP